MKITKISHKAGMYVHICPLCDEVKASGSDISSLPEFSICDCDRNGNRQKVYELFDRDGSTWIRRNKFPRFIGRITFGALSDIDDVEVIDECTDLELTKAMRKAAEFLNKKKEMLTKEEESIICKQYADNRKLKQIASNTEVSESTVMAVLKRNGIPLRGGKRITKEQEEQIVFLYQKEYSILDIISKSGVKSEQTIYRILKAKKIQLRSKK